MTFYRSFVSHTCRQDWAVKIVYIQYASPFQYWKINQSKRNRYIPGIEQHSQYSCLSLFDGGLVRSCLMFIEYFLHAQIPLKHFKWIWFFILSHRIYSILYSRNHILYLIDNKLRPIDFITCPRFKSKLMADWTFSLR